MKNKLIGWIIFVIIILIVVGLVIKNWDSITGITGSKKVTNKAEAIKILLKDDPTRKESILNSFGDDYLIAWATAVKNDQPTFTLNNKIYNSNTGKAV